MKIKVTRSNGTVIEAEGDAAEVEAFMRGAACFKDEEWVVVPGVTVTGHGPFVLGETTSGRITVTTDEIARGHADGSISFTTGAS